MATYGVWQNNEKYRCVLTFDNGATYEVKTGNINDKVLKNLQINESSAITSGNPVGIMSPNNCNISIYSANKVLLQTNTNSPFYGYMRNGVKVNLYITDDGVVWEPFGEYYTEGWSTTRSNGAFGWTNLTCIDKLSYIGNKDIPKLSAYSGVNVVDLLKEIFKAVGLTDADFSIDSSLSLNLVYAITRGSKLRDVLNTIAQSLLARVSVDRAGVISVTPAFPNTQPVATLTRTGIESIAINHNQLSVYNNVKLSYNKVGDRPSEELLSLTNVAIKPGLNTFNNLQLATNILGIDGVYIETEATPESYIDKVQYIDYKASQGGIDVEIFSNMTEDFFCKLTVEGRSTGLTDAYVESGVSDTDAKIANTLSLESYVIQDEVTAQDYVNKVVDYLHSMEQEIVINGALSPYFTAGLYVNINVGDSELDGKYLITRFDLAVGDSYTTNLTLVKIRG